MQTEDGIRYYGLYRAQVVDINDDLKGRRIRVTIPTFGEGAETTWCLPSLAFNHDFVPKVGETVWIEFEQGDFQFPIYSADFTTLPDISPEMTQAYEDDPDNIHNFQLIFDYNGNKIFKTPDGILVTDAAGQTVEMFAKSGEEKIEAKDKSGNIILMDKDGMILTEKNGNKITMDTNGTKIEDKNSNIIEMKSGEISFNGGNVQIF